MDQLKETLLGSFPEFQKSQEFIQQLVIVGKVMKLKSGTTIFEVGDFIKVIPFLIDGLIKIYREDSEGNEILLYYINSGESCAISITATLKDEKSSIKAIVEEDSTLLAVPNKDFAKLISNYNLLHTFTYDLFNLKYNELIKSIDSLAFSDMRTRLYQYLNSEAERKNTDTITGITHKQIAKDLSTSREVISRSLYTLQKEGKIIMENKKITLRKQEGD